MDYLVAFLVGGTICAIGQVLLDTSKLSPPHMLVAFVVAGAILSGLGVYDKLVDFAGAGALIPVSGFGHSIARGSLMEAERLGVLGLFLPLSKAVWLIVRTSAIVVAHSPLTVSVV